ncbi:MAG TPA: AraC family transcriptional regulator [Puia sp.]|nr:AraC family transcriptional regulator [Puia sp.]
MKARYEDLKALKGSHSFRAFRRVSRQFEFNWHYHPEFEITWVEKGHGNRLVGDHFVQFKPDDLVIIGKNLPHTWASDQMVKGKLSATVIQFDEDILKSFLDLAEFESVKKLLWRARLGLFFPGKNIQPAIQLIKELPDKKGVEKISWLLKILDLLTRLKSVSLASAYFEPARGDLNKSRIIRVCQYIQENSTEKISITDTAAMIHLSKSAFCKFFKRTTGHTFSYYVNEIRIGQAAVLLAESDKTIADICYSCGFESLTYFNRVFLKKKGLSPREFRKKF